MKRNATSRPSRTSPAPKKEPHAADHAPPAARADGPAEEAHPREGFPIVGIGASAGGLEAFTQMLHALPVDTSMAFILVPHLDPTHASMLTEILSRATSMRVAEVKDQMPVEPNHVYVIPPGTNMVISEGVLQLSPRTEIRGLHRPIDPFFRSLAEDQGHNAIGVILSGTATDGTLGLGAIKAEGGFTFAQDDTAQYDSMPRSAVAAGCVDFVMPPDEIAKELARIGRHPYVAPAAEGKPEETAREPNLGQVLELLRNATQVDFTHYKRNTLYRRITRRMVLHKMEGLEDYRRFLQSSPAELEALYQDLLISVTSFFRNPEAFAVLKTDLVPRLTRDRFRHEPVRIWVLGCSTGEEAYSIAITFTEVAEASSRPIPVQVFASDLNQAAIEKARAGIYSKNILHDVPPERLRRFFVEVGGNYQISNPIRDMCVFTQHNVLTDPPFSRIDLLSCRNLLIYLEPVLQQKIVSTLHYALKPTGFLWLGSSETIGPYRDLFELENAKHKIYAKKPGPARLTTGFPLVEHAAEQRGLALKPGKLREAGVGGLDAQKEAERILLTRYAPPGVLINTDLEILQFRGDTGPYLTPAPGRASLNLLKMVREGLLVAVRAAVHKAKREEVPVREESVHVKSDGGYRDIDVEVIPVKGNSATQGCLLVLFSEATPLSQREKRKKERPRPDTAITSQAKQETADRQIARLTQELAATREYLQSVIEQQEAANQELQSAYQEVQSANEELQSINEELETSKEEIQSSNEELTTLSDELQNRNLELSQSNNDLLNLLSSVQMAIVMLGPDLSIRRFTAMAGEMLNLIPSDVGRPISDFKLNIDAPELEQLLRGVIDTVTAKDQEVQDKKGCWYSLRVRPYKTLGNKIDGAVLMLVDVDTLKRAEALIQEARAYAENIVATVREPLLVLDGHLRVQTANNSFYEIFKVPPAETEGQLVYDLGNRQWNILELRRLLEEILPRHNEFNDFVVRHEFEHIGTKTMVLNGRRLEHGPGRPAMILLAIDDITERKRTEEEIRKLNEQLERRVLELAAANQELEAFTYSFSHDLRAPLRHIDGFSNLLIEEYGPRLDATAQHHLQRIREGTQQMGRMVDNLLSLGRVGRQKLNLQVTDLNSLVEGALADLKPETQGREIEWQIGQLPDVECDPALMRQVFANLLSNAIKFTRPRAPGVIEVGTTSQKGQPVVFVRDNGVGFSMKYADKLFGVFQRLHRPEDFEGTGVGLATVERIIHKHEGHVWAEAELEKGATFYFTLGASEGGTKEAVAGVER